MSKVQQIEAQLEKLSPQELQEVRTWLDDFFKDHVELADEVKAALDESRAQIAGQQWTSDARRKIDEGWNQAKAGELRSPEQVRERLAAHRHGFKNTGR